jgi:REP element-mobilizing transposase RayT
MFLQLLGVAAKRFHWIVSAYVLPTNHFHLLIETPEANRSRGMQWLAGAYAMWFNRRHGRSAHLFPGRFHSFLIDRDEYFAEVLRYHDRKSASMRASRKQALSETEGLTGIAHTGQRTVASGMLRRGRARQSYDILRRAGRLGSRVTDFLGLCVSICARYSHNLSRS